ncbi:MAG: sulfur carrier protein ThiS adenylyltransferase ThiF [Bacteroidales bacterium]|nr:sulfur carrier protein ThiS adenylyltransferase ThiF [Bacteroidales bacterium]
MKFEQINKILQTKTIGIAGCGGLGSNCAVALARVGVGKLIIADFDVVEKNNLNRQYYFFDQIGEKKVIALKDNIKKINPEVNVRTYNIKLNPESLIKVFSSCDIIVEAFDLAEMKQMIIETVLSEMPGKPIISGLGVAGWGDNDSIKTRRVGDLYICGDEKTETSENMPPMAPKVGIVANMQANLVLEIILSRRKK